MGVYEDVMTIDNADGHEADSQMEYMLAMQRTINAGNWSLQGSFGRAMMDAITEGYCLLGRNAARDYYGNRIPSREEVVDGTKGSYGYVVEHKGKAWADAMAAA